MATLDVIRRLTLRAKAEGFNEAERDVKSLGEAYESSARRQVSVEKSLQNLERRFITGAKAQQDFEKVQRQVNAVMAQNPALQARANAVLAEAHKQLTNVSQSGGVLTKQFALLNAEAQGLASSLGRVAPFLVALGPLGLTMAAGLGVAVVVFKQLADASLELANRAGDLVDLSDSIGLTVKQLQALEIAGSKVGINATQLRTGLERFADSLSNVRQGEEGAVKAVDKLNPGLSKQLQTATTVSQALNLVFDALTKVDQVSAIAAARDIFGRGASGFVRLAASVGDVNKFAEALNNMDLITRKQAESWDAAGDTIKLNLELIKQNLTAAFADDVLDLMQRMSEAALEFARSVRELSESAEGLSFEGIFSIFLENTLLQRITATASALASLADILYRLSPVGLAVAAATGTMIENLKAIGDAALNAKDQVSFLVSELDQAQGHANFLGANAIGTAQGHANLLGTNDPEVENRLKRQTTAVKEQRKAVLDYVDVLKNNVSALGEAATEAEKYQAKVAELAQKLQEGTISQDTFNRAVAQLNPAMKAIQTTIADVGAALAQAFIEGADAAEALHRSLKAVASTAASATINNLIKGDLGAAAISATVAVGSFALDKLFGGGDKKAQEEAAKKATEAMNKANDALKSVTDSFMAFTAAADGAVTSVIKNGQQQFDQLKQAADAALAAANTLVNTPGNTPAAMAAANQSRDLANASVISATARLKEFNERTIETGRESLRGAVALSAVQQALKDLDDKAKDLQQAMELVGTSSEEAAEIIRGDLAVALDRLTNATMKDLERAVNDLQGTGYINGLADALTKMADASLTGADPELIARFFTLSAQGIVDSAKLTGDAFNQLIETFPELEGVVVEFSESATEAAAAISAAAERLAALNDRAFAATNRGNDLSSQLARFDYDAQRQREAEIKAGGENITRLEEVLALERSNVIKDANENILAEQKRTEEERFDIIKKANEDIIAYLNGLLTGQLSPLSAKAQLDAARQLYEAQLALAKSGDLTALQNITKSADTLLNASKAFYGSSAGYQRDFEAIRNQLSGLVGMPAAGSVVGLSNNFGAPLAPPTTTGSAGLGASPANDNNVWASGFALVSSLLTRIAELEQETKQAILDQTESLNKETRFSDRKAERVA